MKGLIAIVLLLVAAGSASAHGGRVVFVPDGFGGARAVVVQDHFVPRGGFYGTRGFVPRGNVTPFNQNGGVNRIGRRR